jgi:hypothetical protein
MTPLCLGLELMILGARVCLGDAAEAPQQPMAVVVCPTLEDWPVVEQQVLAAELRARPNPVTMAAIQRLARARAQIRACQQAQKR